MAFRLYSENTVFSRMGTKGGFNGGDFVNVHKNLNKIRAFYLAFLYMMKSIILDLQF